MADTDKLALPLIAESQEQKNVTHNEALYRLEAFVAGARSMTNSGPPATPAAGDVYIVDAATGAWASASVDDVAHYYGGAWHFYPAAENTVIYVHDDALKRYNGSGWVAA